MSAKVFRKCSAKVQPYTVVATKVCVDISIFVFCNFCEKFENSKWPPFLARQKLFENWDGYSAEIPCRTKISSFLCFAIFVKNSKIQKVAIFGETKIF